MAEPSDQDAATPTGTLRCPRCGTIVTAEPARTHDKGTLFECPNCGTHFGIVPGIPGAHQRSPQQD